MLTRYCYERLREIDGIEVGPEPEVSILFFRYMPETGDPNDFNKELIDYIHRDGRIFLSSTHINGTIYLRIALLSFRTHLDEVELILDIINEAIEYVRVNST